MSRKRLTDADKRLIDRWTRGNPSAWKRLGRLRGAALAKRDFAAWGKDISKRELARMREFFRATARWGYRQRDLGWMLGMHRAIRRNPTWKQKRKMSGKGFQRMLAEQAEMLTGMRFARKIRGHAAGAVEDAAARLQFVRRWTMPRRLSPEARALLKAARELRGHRPASWGGGMFHNYVLRPRVEEARKALVATRTWRRRNPPKRRKPPKGTKAFMNWFLKALETTPEQMADYEREALWERRWSKRTKNPFRGMDWGHRVADSATWEQVKRLPRAEVLRWLKWNDRELAINLRGKQDSSFTTNAARKLMWQTIKDNMAQGDPRAKNPVCRRNPWGPFLGGMAAGAGMHVMTRALNAIQQNPKRRRR